MWLPNALLFHCVGVRQCSHRPAARGMISIASKAAFRGMRCATGRGITPLLTLMARSSVLRYVADASHSTACLQAAAADMSRCRLHVHGLNRQTMQALMIASSILQTAPSSWAMPQWHCQVYLLSIITSRLCTNTFASDVNPRSQATVKSIWVGSRRHIVCTVACWSGQTRGGLCSLVQDHL